MPLNQKTDEELMLIYQSGSEEAFRILYQRHASKIYGFIKRRINSAERSNDIFQEVFIKLHKSKGLYKRGHPFFAWIFTITKNAMIDETRKNKKFAGHDQIDGLELPGPAAQDEDKFSEVIKLLDKVPKLQRSAIEMRYEEEKTFLEIAEVLKTSETNVRQLISRGISRLKELIKDGDSS